MEAEWAADRDHQLAHLQSVGVAELGGHQIARIRAKDRQVGEWVGSSHLDPERAAVRKGGATAAVGALDHVCGAQQEPVGGDRDRAPASFGPPAASPPLHPEIGHRRPQPIGDGGHRAGVGVERLGIGEGIVPPRGRDAIRGTLDQSQASHESNLATSRRQAPVCATRYRILS